MSGTSTPASNSFEGAYEIYPNLFGTGGSLPGIPRGDTVTAISTDGVTFTVVNPGSTSASSGATVGGTYLSFSADSAGDVSISPLQPNQSLIDQINANSGALTPLSDTLYYQVSDANGQISSFADQFALGDTSFSEPDMPPYSQLGTVSPGDTLDLGGLTVSKALSTNQTDNSGYTLSVSVGVFDFSNQAPDGQLSVSTDVEGGGGTVTYGDPTNPAYLQLTIEGTIAEINADLTTLAYTAVNPGSDAVVLADTDSPTPITNVIVGNIEVPCFCRGTLIRTPRGEVPVERLRVGDEVTTLSGQARPLTWVGRGRSLVTAANPNARPIIVRQGALADGVPARDLYLTRGHSLLLDGVLIPVEYLVNDRSVLWDAQARVVEFFHLELEHHDILLADDAEAESYREDGNRHLFHNTDAPRHATHGMAPYAPVRTGGPEVDRVWARLLARTAPAEADLTEDADLHLLADGARVEGVAEDPMRHRFRLERVPFELRIGSRVCNPVRMGTGRDPRDLGVALRRLVLRGEGAELVLGWDSHWLTEGFNGPEPDAQSRWTTGNAVVPARALAAFEGALEVEVELGMLTRYPLPTSETDAIGAVSPPVAERTGTGG